MTYFFRKMHLAITFLCTATISYAYADTNNFSSCDENNECIACQPSCCGTLFGGVGIVYWRAFESGLDNCVPTDVTDIVLSDGTVISRFKGKSRDPHFEWNPGFRVGIGYEFACRNWDIGALWTSFHSKAHDSNNCGDRIRWNLNFDVVDVIAGYNANLGSCFLLRPFVGLRGATIDQKLHIGEFSSLSSSSIYSSSFSTYSSLIGNISKERFSGIGPLIGLEAEWNVFCDFSLYIAASVSWLYGNFNVELSQYDEFSYAIDSCRVTKHLNANVTAGDAEIGIRWQKCFCENMNVILQFGLEHHSYFDFNRIGNYGDLSFDGVNFCAIVEY